MTARCVRRDSGITPQTVILRGTVSVDCIAVESVGSPDTVRAEVLIFLVPDKTVRPVSNGKGMQASPPVPVLPLLLQCPVRRDYRLGKRPTVTVIGIELLDTGLIVLASAVESNV